MYQNTSVNIFETKQNSSEVWSQHNVLHLTGGILTLFHTFHTFSKMFFQKKKNENKK